MALRLLKTDEELSQELDKITMKNLKMVPEKGGTVSEDVAQNSQEAATVRTDDFLIAKEEERERVHGSYLHAQGQETLKCRNPYIEAHYQASLNVEREPRKSVSTHSTRFSTQSYLEQRQREYSLLREASTTPLSAHASWPDLSTERRSESETRRSLMGKGSGENVSPTKTMEHAVTRAFGMTPARSLSDSAYISEPKYSSRPLSAQQIGSYGGTSRDSRIIELEAAVELKTEEITRLQKVTSELMGSFSEKLAMLHATMNEAITKIGSLDSKVDELLMGQRALDTRVEGYHTNIKTCFMNMEAPVALALKKNRIQNEETHAPSAPVDPTIGQPAVQVAPGPSIVKEDPMLVVAARIREIAERTNMNLDGILSYVSGLYSALKRNQLEEAIQHMDRYLAKLPTARGPRQSK